MNTTKPLVEIQCPFLNLTNSTMFCHVTTRDRKRAIATHGRGGMV